MAANQTVKANDNIKQQDTPIAAPKTNKKKKGPGFFSFLFPILLATSIIFGTWAYFIKANKFGLGEKMRPTLKDIPLVRAVLPPSPDPEAAENMPEDMIAMKYEEYREKIKELNNKIAEQNKLISDLQKYKDNEMKARNEINQQKIASETEAKKIAAERKQLEAEKLKFAIDVKNKDKQGFSEYFENISPDIAQQVYEKVMRENQVDAKVSNYVKTFEGMEPESAAKILENMGYSNMQLVANIITMMKRQSAADILSNMDPVFAANLEDTIAVDYPIYPKE